MSLFLNPVFQRSPQQINPSNPVSGQSVQSLPVAAPDTFTPSAVQFGSRVPHTRRMEIDGLLQEFSETVEQAKQPAAALRSPDELSHNAEGMFTAMGMLLVDAGMDGDWDVVAAGLQGIQELFQSLDGVTFAQTMLKGRLRGLSAMIGQMAKVHAENPSAFDEPKPSRWRQENNATRHRIPEYPADSQATALARAESMNWLYRKVTGNIHEGKPSHEELAALSALTAQSRFQAGVNRFDAEPDIDVVRKAHDTLRKLYGKCVRSGVSSNNAATTGEVLGMIDVTTWLLRSAIWGSHNLGEQSISATFRVWLVKKGLGHPSSKVRAQAAECLYMLARGEQRSQLYVRVAGDSSALVREVVNDGMERRRPVPSRSARPPQLSQKDELALYKKLGKDLKDQSVSVRLAAIQEIDSLSSPDFQYDLLMTAIADRNDQVMMAALEKKRALNLEH